MGLTFSQFFPPRPTLTEANLPSQTGKIFIVTGGYSGVGLELSSILYHAGGKVYIAGRSKEKAEEAISKIKSRPDSLLSAGSIFFLELALDDLTTIKPAVEKFTSTESRLDVLFNNAGVSNPPTGSVSTQGHDLQLATNCLGSYLLTQLLLPILLRTAKDSDPASVRVVWTSSIVVEVSAPANGMNISDFEKPPADPQHNYVTSKTGNWFLANALSHQVGAEGILSVTQNPGNLKSALVRHLPRYVPILVAPLLYDAKMGAYTELFAGLSPKLKLEDGGKYIIPWGRVHPNPYPQFLTAMKAETEGGTGIAEKFVTYCDKETASFR